MRVYQFTTWSGSMGCSAGGDGRRRVRRRCKGGTWPERRRGWGRSRARLFGGACRSATTRSPDFESGSGAVLAVGWPATAPGTRTTNQSANVRSRIRRRGASNAPAAMLEEARPAGGRFGVPRAGHGVQHLGRRHGHRPRGAAAHPTAASDGGGGRGPAAGAKTPLRSEPRFARILSFLGGRVRRRPPTSAVRFKLPDAESTPRSVDGGLMAMPLGGPAPTSAATTGGRAAHVSRRRGRCSRCRWDQTAAALSTEGWGKKFPARPHERPPRSSFRLAPATTFRRLDRRREPDTQVSAAGDLPPLFELQARRFGAAETRPRTDGAAAGRRAFQSSAAGATAPADGLPPARGLAARNVSACGGLAAVGRPPRLAPSPGAPVDPCRGSAWRQR